MTQKEWLDQLQRDIKQRFAAPVLKVVGAAYETAVQEGIDSVDRGIESRDIANTGKKAPSQELVSSLEEDARKAKELLIALEEDKKKLQAENKSLIAELKKLTKGQSRGTDAAKQQPTEDNTLPSNANLSEEVETPLDNILEGIKEIAEEKPAE